MSFGHHLAETKAARTAYTIAGTISLALGSIGAFLPILPTTPFLILSAYCYSKGSEHLHSWLLGHRIFGEYISNYMAGHGMKKKDKLITVSFLWAILLISIIFINKNITLQAFLILTGALVSLHILSISTAENKKESAIPDKIKNN